ncbi:MAG TPA: hypothetical protein VHO24_00835 [Opitutaceae bacterium]|nr:hypothetical protein [Opitutaceae bacterium]
MSKKKTCVYIQDGHEEGPYLESQIIRMADAGIIRADAEIRCVEDGRKGSLTDFLGALEKDLDGGVTVTDVRMPFGSMVVFMVKWAIASIPAAMILFALFAFMTAVLSRL